MLFCKYIYLCLKSSSALYKPVLIKKDDYNNIEKLF